MSRNPLISLGVSPQDVAPGDANALAFDWSGLKATIVSSANNEHFDAAYAALWAEFGAGHAIELRATLEQRFTWRPESPIDGFAMLYEMLVIYSTDGIVAVHDHTAAVNLRSDEDLIVHLSHIWIAPHFRGRGLVGWLRAVPLRAARECIRRANISPRPITLVAEMDHADAAFPDRMSRLRSYERGGYSKIDPNAAPYTQPDFRDPDLIDATGGPRPIPYALIVRRIGRESETSVTGHDVRSILQTLHHIYGQTIRSVDMKPNRRLIEKVADASASIALIPPTSIT